MFSAEIRDNVGDLIRVLDENSFFVVNITNEINGRDTAEIRVPSFLGIDGTRRENPILKDLSVRMNGIRKINIFYTNSKDVKINVFSGFIFTATNTPLQVVYQCEGISTYLQRKHINLDRSYNGPGNTIASILTNEWANINNRYPTGINIVVSNNNIATATVNRGEKYGQLLDRMAEYGNEYRYVYPNIEVAPVIGNVLTKTMSYDYSSQQASNVAAPDRTDEDGSLLGTACFGKVGTGGFFFSDIPPTQEEITIFKNFADGDSFQKAQKYVQDYKTGELAYELLLDDAKWEIGEVNPGDFVNIDINYGFSPMDVKGQVRVMRRSLVQESGALQHRVSLSNVPFQENVTEDILKRVKTLEDIA